MDKKTKRTGEQIPGTRDRKIDNKRDEENYTDKMKDVRYRKVWKITERNEGQVNKEHVREIVLLGIVLKDESKQKEIIQSSER
jgi:hypothetical protein